MTRVAYVSADPGVPIFGRKGCSIHAQEVLRAMLRRGVQVDLFSTNVEGEPSAGLEALCVRPLARIPKGGVAAREQAALAGNDLLERELKLAGPFAFVYERYSLWSHAAMTFARSTGVPGLLEVNAPLIEEQAQYRVLVDRSSAEQVAEKVFGAATALLAVSEEVAAWLEGFPAAGGKVHVVPNGIRPDRFPERVLPALPTPPGMFTVGFVGTLKSWHGLPVLVEAFAKLHACQPKTRLLIVGDGPERDKLVADVAARGLQQATVLTGSVAPGEVPSLLASMDVAVAPYPALDRFYFSPLKVYEYMAASLPVVASRIGQLQTLIEENVTGLLVPPGDVATLATALEQLHKNPQQRERLGRAARQTVLRFYTWDAVVQRILSLAGMNHEAVPGAPAVV